MRMKVNRERDIPLLMRIYAARYVTSKQLLQYALAAQIANSEGAFYWRTKRYLEVGLIETVKRSVGDCAVYRLKPAGIRLLEQETDSLLPVTGKAKVVDDGRQIHHALTLNEIRFRLEHDWGAQQYQTDLELSDTYAKDYDAVCLLPRDATGKPPIRAAIEFERTRKAAARYEAINDALNDESEISMLLYVCGSSDLMVDVATRLTSKSAVIAFTTTYNFLSAESDCVVFIWVKDRLQPVRFAELLTLF